MGVILSNFFDINNEIYINHCHCSNLIGKNLINELITDIKTDNKGDNGIYYNHVKKNNGK